MVKLGDLDIDNSSFSIVDLPDYKEYRNVIRINTSEESFLVNRKILSFFFLFVVVEECTSL